MRDNKPGRMGLLASMMVASALATACGGADQADQIDRPPAPAAAPQPGATPWPVRVELPADLGEVDSGLRDVNGHPIGVACASCHESHAEAPFAQRVEELKDFHTDLKFAHGDQRCFACHAPEDRSLLRLADDRRIELAEVQTLCSQCHGPQARDWRRGSHGGMRGYWDLSRGPRVRASCVSCHDAHAPAWPQVQPVFKPKDRFLSDVEPHP